MFRDSTCRLLLPVAVMISCVSAAWADYEGGRTAWQAGRHAQALTQWQAAAKAGDPRAMLALGRAYVKGLGVPQDYVEAHKWLNLAAARGNVEAAAEREALNAKMAPQQVAAAQERVRSWKPDSGVNVPKAADPRRTIASSPPAGPPPPRAIREAQALMTALGYKPGPADGRWGPRTGRAYAAFLRDAGLSTTEMLTPDALRAMRAAAKGRNVAAAGSSPRRAPTTQRNIARPPTNLHRLVAAGDLDGLKAALVAGADPNTRDSKGWTPLMHAADRGYTLLVPPLLAAKAAVDIQAPDGATALFMAALHGHSEIITALLMVGADGGIEGPKGTTAADLARRAYGGLDAARLKGASPKVLALLEKGAPTPEELSQEIRKKKEAIRRKLLDCDTFPIDREKYPNSENYHGVWRALGVHFVEDEVKIEVVLYQEESSRIEPSHPAGTTKYIYTFRIMDIHALAFEAGQSVKNPRTGLHNHNLVLKGSVKEQWKTWDMDASRHPIAYFPKVIESHTAFTVIPVCARVTAENVAEDINSLKKTYTLLR